MQSIKMDSVIYKWVAVLNVTAVLCVFQGCVVEPRELQLGRPASWTGLGFARVPQGGSLEFSVTDMPYSMEYDLLLRYESQVSVVGGAIHVITNVIDINNNDSNVIVML